MAKKIAILQSNYIPWKGYFDLMSQVDEFIIFDEVQYTKGDWRNRNLIKTAQGLKWLTIPIMKSNSLQQRVCEIQVSDAVWRKKHWQSLITNYSKAPYFKTYSDFFETLYLENNESILSKINVSFMTLIKQILGISTVLTWSSDYSFSRGKTARLVQLCLDCGADEYVSGPSAKDYVDQSLFDEAGIKLSWMDYSGYQPYHQLFSTFEHRVSAVDLIFNEGPNSKRFLKSFSS
ncbi:MAG: WbqC family protein [Methylococcaceae bacterium]